MIKAPDFIKIIMLMVCFFVSNSCKKDYPNDTPKWLKEKIIEYKRIEDNLHIQTPVSIDEYKNGNNEVIYVFYFVPFNGGNVRNDLYDLSGNTVCSCHWLPECIINGVTVLNGYSKTRTIWVCSFCNN